MAGVEKQMNELALIGMDMRAGGWAGLTALSRRLFHGESLADAGAQPSDLAGLARQAIDQAGRDAGWMAEDMEIILFSPLLKDIRLAGKVNDLSASENPIQSAVAGSAGHVGASLWVDADARTGLVSAAVVCPWPDAIVNGLRIYAGLTGGVGAASINPHTIGLLEISGPRASTALTDAFSSVRPLTVALDAALPGLAGLVKAAWCLYERLIPAVPPTDLSASQAGAFIIASDARAWFLEPGQTRRWVFLDLPGSGLLLKEESHPEPVGWGAPAQEDFHLFPLAAPTFEQLLEKITSLQTEAERGLDLQKTAARAFHRYEIDAPAAEYRACLLAHTPAELQAECGFALKGLPGALEKQADWQTPLGSYFTPRPLGRDGQVSFIYPGGFNSYVGLGRGLFHLFPHLLDRLQVYSADTGSLINEKKLYPRGQRALSAEELEKAEEELNRDPVALLISGSTLAVLYTLLLQETFGLQAGSAFGYSLGEISMMFASGAWSQAEEITGALRASPLFQNRLAGRQEAVREFWQNSGRPVTEASGPVWSNHVLMTDEGLLRQALSAEANVFLTHINTPRQFVIGGDPAACRRVIAALKCPSLQAPYNFALHCDAIRSEYDALVALHSWRVNPNVSMRLYSAYDGLPMPLEREAVAKRIAAGLSSSLDFPHLVRQVYDGGARIFIELGAGSNCGRWIDETLKSQPHAAFSINRKGADDYTSILRLLARLTCHQVNLKLNTLYT